MQYVQNSILFVLISVLISCGGGDTKQTSSENTAVVTPMAILSSLGSNPENGDGTIEVSAITSQVNDAGGDQVVRITGVTGSETNRILHQIDVHYYIYYNADKPKGSITMVTHAWGSSLSNSIDGGISICEEDCGETEIHPALNTLIFSNQTLDATANVNVLQGTVVYPNQTPAAE